MQGRFWKSIRRFALFGCVGLLMSTGVARAENNELDLLREQIELQKEQITRQQEQLERLQIAVEKQQPAASTADVRGMVGAYLAEEKKKEAAKPAGDPTYEVGKDLNFKPSWKDGLFFETADKAFSCRVIGRVHNDWGFIRENGTVDGREDMQDGVTFRRARLGVNGLIWEVFEYSAEFDFAGKSSDDTANGGNSIQWRNVYLGVTQLPYIGTVRIGHFKEPFSLEQRTSSNHISFIERSIIDDAFAPAYNTGIMATNTFHEDHGQWALGLFRQTDDFGGEGSEENGGFGNEDVEDPEDLYAVTCRLTYLPWYENDGRCLLHLGVASSYRHIGDSGENPFRFRSRPYRAGGTTFSEEFIEVVSGDIPGNQDSFALYGLESAIVLGPFSAQAEYIAADVQNGPTFYGYYAYVSYFLTGEHRAYDRKSGSFSRVRPLTNFWLVKVGDDDCDRAYCCGKGAWELLARYAYLDLSEGGVDEGTLRQYTLGVNWYWNPNMRVMFNYEHLDINDTDLATAATEADTWVVRFQVDF